MYILLTLLSAVSYGFYGIFKKITMKKNKIINVLLLEMIICTIVVGFFNNNFDITRGNLILTIIKSLVIMLAWMLSLSSIKHLPISIITPFNFIRPVMVTILAFFVFNQHLTYFQMIGIAVLTITYIMFGKTAKKEDINLLKNKYFYMFLISCVLNVISAMLDKVILETMDVGALQFYFSLFIMIGFLFISLFTKSYKEIKFDKNILFLAAFFILGDRIYFSVIQNTDINIGIIHLLKQFSIVISAMLGGLIYKEKNLKDKFKYIIVIMLGMVLIVL